MRSGDAIEASSAAVRYAAMQAALEVVRRSGELITYSGLAPIAGYHERDGRFHELLKRSMREDREAGRPYICSLVVNKKKGMPGEAYFGEAIYLGDDLGDMTQEHKMAFWRSHVDRLHEGLAALLFRVDLENGLPQVSFRSQLTIDVIAHVVQELVWSMSEDEDELALLAFDVVSTLCERLEVSPKTLVMLNEITPESLRIS